MSPDLKTVITILAAGSSSRLGQPKQNLIYKEQTLLQRITREAKKVSAKVLVVLGANAQYIEPTLANENIITLLNTDWHLGMASSLSLATSYVQTKIKEAGAILFTVCDQPFVDAAVLNALIESGGLSGKGIVASRYNDMNGVPALFKSKYYPQLIGLKGNQGAKAIIGLNNSDVKSVSFPAGNIDIDTMDDYARLII